MSLDVRITEAIEEAVEEAGQPASLARRLIAWFEAIASGNEDINDSAVTGRHLDVLFQGTEVEGSAEEEQH